MDSEERMVDLREGALREVQTLSDEIAHDVRRIESLPEGALTQSVLSRAITRTERMNDLLRECWRADHDSSMAEPAVLSGILSVFTPMTTARNGTNAAEAVSSAILAYEYENQIDLASEAPHRFALIETRWVRKITRTVMDNCNEDGAVINAIMRTIIRTDNVKCLVFFGVRTLEAPEGDRIGTEFQLIPSEKFQSMTWI